MMRATLSRWAAWSPDVDDEEGWAAWARNPEPLAGRGAPNARFLPAATRRRCDALSRAMLEVANACCDDSRRSQIACVFASRHGAFAATVSLLEVLAADEPLSPTRFSHSVHNTQSALFSIWARNREASTAVAARAESFAHGFLEAVALLRREPGRPVLLVTGDEPLPTPLAPLGRGAAGLYALALLLSPNGDAPSVGLRLGPTAGEGGGAPWPPALEFLRWWLSDEPTLRLASPLHTWVFDRGC